MEAKSFFEVLVQPWILQGKNVVFAALGWTLVQVVVTLVIRGVEKEKFKGKKDDRPIRVCAMLHALVACFLALKALSETDSAIYADRINGVSPTSHLLHICSVGYFLWDVIVVLLYQESFGFLLHAVGCLFMFSNCLYPYIQFYGCIFLLYELSTPFLHIRGFLIDLKRTDTALFKFSQLMFALTFFVVRIAVGWPTLLWWVSDLWGQYQAGTAHSGEIVLVYLFFGLSLNVLNIYWFFQITRRALRGGAPQKEKEKQRSD